MTGTLPNVQFYETLWELIEEEYTDVRFILAHRGNGRWSLQQRYQGVPNLDVISVPAGIVPPLKLVLREGQPIALQSEWMRDILKEHEEEEEENEDDDDED